MPAVLVVCTAFFLRGDCRYAFGHHKVRGAVIVSRVANDILFGARLE
jgi:hypothetical protein